jgi:hypothetical protein
MQHQEIVTRLAKRMIAVNPSEIIYSITMQSIISAIVQRLGEEALDLSVDDLHLARDEVKIAISHNLDERDYIDMGLDVWEITRRL